MTSPPERPLLEPPPSRLYTLADTDTLGLEGTAVAVEAMAEAGVEWIQIRAKGVGGGTLFHLLETVLRHLEGAPVTLWVDDRADLLALFPATAVAGVHLGQRALPPAAVRPWLSGERRIGLSTHNEKQVEEALADPTVDAIDAVAVGPIFETRSKNDPDPAVGLDLVRRTRQRLEEKAAGRRRPLLAIGGLAADNLPAVLEAGADVAVVLGAACRGDVYRNCRRLLKAAA